MLEGYLDGLWQLNMATFAQACGDDFGVEEEGVIARLQQLIQLVVGCEDHSNCSIVTCR